MNRIAVFIKSPLILALGLFAQIAVAAPLQAQTEYRFQGGDEETRYDVERRFPGWVARGAVEEELDTAVRASTCLICDGEGSWVRNMAGKASRHLSDARNSEKMGNMEAAAKAYSRAAAFYGVARFPFLHSDEARQAYSLHNETYLKAQQLKGVDVERLLIPFEGKDIIGLFYRPSESENKTLPLVVISGGIDTWKNENWPTVKEALRQGFAVFAMDMPGTGESQWLLEPNSDRVYAAAIRSLLKRPEIESHGAGVSLMSFSGLYAVRLALTEPLVKAAVNFGGPIHYSFTADHVGSVPSYLVAAVLAGFGLDYSDVDHNIEAARATLVRESGRLSLKTQNMLKRTKDQGALLTINGDNDHLVPIEDIWLISASGVRQETWVYADGGHTAAKFRHENGPDSFAWIKRQLSRAQ